MTKQCITFAPFLKELNGHVKDYHESLQRIFSSLGYSCKTLVQEACLVDPLPKNWQKGLYDPPKWSRRSVLAKACPTLINFKTLKKLYAHFESALTQVLDPKASEILWVFETFNTFHLQVIVKLLKRFKQFPIKVLFIYRYNSKQLFFKGKKDAPFLKNITKLVGKNHLLLCADTELLCDELGSFFKRAFHLLPIPHTHLGQESAQPTSNKHALHFWWPGVPRTPKGILEIQRLCQMKVPKSLQIFLKLSEKTPLPFEESMVTIEKISNCLSREQYLQHFNAAQIILLPYSNWNYSHSSSGIFVEALFMGKMPLVSQGTWMAYELKKFNLEELIVSFNETDFYNQVQQLYLSKQVQDKLKQMQNAYQKTHNEKLFAQTIQTLL